MRPFLETDRLTLRRFTDADEDNLVELNSDPEVMRFLNGGQPTPRVEVRTRIIPTFLGYYERFEGFGFWAAEETATGQFLGWFHFRPPIRDADTPAGWDEAGVIELGYRLRRPRGGRATRPRDRLPWWPRGSPSSACSGWSRRPWQATRRPGASW